MADFLLLGLFDNVSITADVIEEVQKLGIQDKHVTVMSNVPYSPKFFGRKHPRSMFLPFVLGGALLGILIAAFISFGTPALYPINVGNQGLNPVPPTAIMFFEFIALSIMLVSFVGFLLQNRFPILTRQIYDERITDGYIGVQVLAAGVTAEKVKAVFEAHHAHVVKFEDAAEYKPQGIRHLFFWGGVGTAGLVLLLIPLLLSYDVIHVPWVNTMDEAISVGAQEGPRRAAPPEAVPVQGPRLIAGEPATMPLEATDTSIARGKALFNINCAICHGEQADGKGQLSKFFNDQSGFPAGVPALKGRGLPGSYIFKIVSNGIQQTDPQTGQETIRMPRLAENVSAGDTWDIINYIDSLSASE
jgi:mono/diheme cytochrome c family protein